MLSSALVVALSVGTHFYTTHGRVELEPVAEQLVVSVVDEAALSQRLAAEPGAQVRRLYGSLRLIEGVGAPGALAYELRKHGVVSEVLAVYLSSEDQLLIADRKLRAHFAETLSAAEITRRVKLAGGVAVHPVRADLGIYEVLAPTPADTVEVAAKLREDRLATWAHPDFIYRKQKRLVPNDPYFSEQWHHDLVVTPAAWDLTLGDSSVIIAILDSGVDTLHPDLTSKLVSPRDTLDVDNDPTPGTDEAHGTGCAGLAGAIGNNNLGVIGTCPDCSIMPIRIMSEEGYGRYGADSDAFRWAVDHDAAVLSNSWGPAGATSVPADLAAAIEYATTDGRDGKGSLVLFASGNDYRENESYELASHPLVLGIGATDGSDRKESYSNWGDELFMTAPAGSFTTDIRGSGGYAGSDYQGYFGGTSAATPVAAGIIGLVLSINPELAREQVISILAETADQIGSVQYTDGKHPYYGFGRVNALRAVQMASGGEVCQPATEICDNGLDEDCDFLIDERDPNCGPSTPQIGIACSQDFQCGPNAYCLASDYGFPGGYCSADCSTSCPDGNLCVDGGRTNFCVDSCSSIADCRQGYDCLDMGDGTKACYPSCTVSGCEVGATCDAATGECVHDGPVQGGGACTQDVECADNGWCMSASWGFPGGFCAVRCGAQTDCAEGQTCASMGRWSMCADTCQRVSDCRSGYTCAPLGDGTGMCWVRCSTSEDCDGAACNEYGLCGTETPPLTTPEPVPLPEGACACDLTTACDADCSCDPECAAEEDDGCAAGEPMSAAALLGVALLLRRRRERN